MIDRDPIETRSQILLHAGHEAPRETLQFLILRGVLGRNDKAELVPVAVAAFQKRLAVRPVVFGIVKLARLPFARHAVALDIAEMETGRLQALPLQLHDAGFDDHAPRAEGGMGSARREHATDAGAAADAIAVKARARRRSTEAASARQRRRFQHALLVAPLGLSGARPDPAETWLEAVVLHRLLSAIVTHLQDDRLSPRNKTAT